MSIEYRTLPSGQFAGYGVAEHPQSFPKLIADAGCYDADDQRAIAEEMIRRWAAWGGLFVARPVESPALDVYTTAPCPNCGATFTPMAATREASEAAGAHNAGAAGSTPAPATIFDPTVKLVNSDFVEP